MAVCVPAYMGREYYIQYKYKEEKRQRMQILQNMQRDTLAAVR